MKKAPGSVAVYGRSRSDSSGSGSSGSGGGGSESPRSSLLLLCSMKSILGPVSSHQTDSSMKDTKIVNETIISITAITCPITIPFSPGPLNFTAEFNRGLRV